MDDRVDRYLDQGVLGVDSDVAWAARKLGSVNSLDDCGRSTWLEDRRNPDVTYSSCPV